MLPTCASATSGRHLTPMTGHGASAPRYAAGRTYRLSSAPARRVIAAFRILPSSRDNPHNDKQPLLLLADPGLVSG